MSWFMRFRRGTYGACNDTCGINHYHSCSLMKKNSYLSQTYTYTIYVRLRTYAVLTVCCVSRSILWHIVQKTGECGIPEKTKSKSYFTTNEKALII